MTPPHRFRLFDSFAKDLFLVLLLNTIRKKQDEGITYTDFQRDDFLPHSKVYRILKKLEDGKLVETRDERADVGRPRQLYRVTRKGEKEVETLRAKVLDTFETFRHALPTLLDGGTFETVKELTSRGPPEECLLDPAERLDFLREVERDVAEHLQHVRDEIARLEREATRP